MPEKSEFQLSGSGPAAYERVWVPALMGRCADELVAAANIEKGDRVLDAGCGTGVVARSAAGRVGRDGCVVGCDLNQGMLDEARLLANIDGLSSIEWSQGNAAAMPFDEASFDVVLCQQGLQFMPDRAAALAEMTRMLRPGGRLALSVWCSRSAFSEALCNVLDAYFGDGTTVQWNVAYSLADREELRSLASDAGLQDVHISLDVKIARHPDPIEFVAGALAGSPLAGDVAAMPVDESTKLIADVVSAMGRCIDDDGVASGAECHTLTARK